MVDERPFEDVVPTGGGFSLPELKWRELLFVGALRRDGETFVRDPSRPLPPFRAGDLFPEGERFTAMPIGRRVLLRRV
ncbi:MAG TPA: hypothetical protein VEQ84_01835 [Vicinamibacteria bacterium]|nr:hypothetical protein [Vicinamibacteria bacterium]